ncbi:hypothetical protein FJZ18_02700, partial [Candidatus Pacearchaeota archaeon]|nr:hypothetical protein [Candidatus Pacearchaeota archaeon]
MSLVKKLMVTTLLASSIFGDITAPLPARQSHSLTGESYNVVAPQTRLKDYVYIGHFNDSNKNGKKDFEEPMVFQPYWERPVLSEGHVVNIILPHQESQVRMIVKEAYSRSILFDFNVIS